MARELRSHMPHGVARKNKKNFQIDMSKQTAGHIEIKPTRIQELKPSLEDH